MIPIYRAKKIDSDEWVEGYLIKYMDNIAMFVHEKYTEFLIDPTTLAIHFPDMLDSEGNKIFASLQEDGRGGSKLLFDDGKDARELVCIYNCYTIDLKPIKIIKDSRKFLGATLNEKLKIIGIKQ